MSRAVLKRRQLAEFAKQLSKRHDEDCTCFDGPFILDECCCETAKPVPEMDARERKWAAQKLLRPIEDPTGCEDFTIHDWIQVAREHWRLRVADRGAQENALERFQRSARQLRHTTAHARALWGLSGAQEVIEEDDDPADETKIDLSWCDNDAKDDADDEDVFDLFDYGTADIRVNYSSDPEDEAPHEEWKDASGKKVKLY